MNFEWVPPDRIGAVWGMVRPGVEKVAKHSGEWIAEDVYMALKQNNAALHLVIKECGYVGFMVTQKQQTYARTKLFVWLAYSEARDFNVLREGIAFLEGLCRQIGASCIKFESPRKGWEKKALELGYVAKSTAFEKEVLP